MGYLWFGVRCLMCAVEGSGFQWGCRDRNLGFGVWVVKARGL